MPARLSGHDSSQHRGPGDAPAPDRAPLGRRLDPADVGTIHDAVGDYPAGFRAVQPALIIVRARPVSRFIIRHSLTYARPGDVLEGLLRQEELDGQQATRPVTLPVAGLNWGLIDDAEQVRISLLVED